MLRYFVHCSLRVIPVVGLWLVGGLIARSAEVLSVITNLMMLDQGAATDNSGPVAVDFKAVVCAASPSGRVFALADQSGAKLVTLENAPLLQAGDLVEVQGVRCTLIRNNWGDSLGPIPLVNDDGLHVRKEAVGTADLSAGPVPIRLEWFNGTQSRALEWSVEGPGLPLTPMPDRLLSHSSPSGARLPGLMYQCYLGDWLLMPEFRNLLPITSGIVNNLTMDVSVRQDLVGLVFTGYFEAPRAGRYTFHVFSDDGAKLFLGPGAPSVRRCGMAPVPDPLHLTLGTYMKASQRSRWTEAQGVVEQIVDTGDYDEIRLLSGQNRLRVLLADRTGLAAALWLNSKLRLRGVGGDIYRLDGTKAFGLLQVASVGDVTLEELAPELRNGLHVTPISSLRRNGSPNRNRPVRVEGCWAIDPKTGAMRMQDATGSVPVRLVPGARLPETKQVTAWGTLTEVGGQPVLEASFIKELATNGLTRPGPAEVLNTAEQVQRLTYEEAVRGLPVRLRGVITCDSSALYYGSILQDSTRGLYVYWDQSPPVTGRLPAVRPKMGEFWEVEGVTTPGKFAPAVNALAMRRLGEGQMPEPMHPTRDQILSGTLDTQLIEVEGIVTELVTNTITLLMHGGTIEAELLDLPPLQPIEALKDQRVRLRGCLLNVWNPTTRQVILGQVRLADVSVFTLPTEVADPFEAPLKTVADLLRFDLESGAFRRVRLNGQLLAVVGNEYLMGNGTNGIRFILREPSDLRPGEMVSVSGIPELGGPSPILRVAVARRVGRADWPASRKLRATDLSLPGLDATRIQVDALVSGVRDEPAGRILDLRAGAQDFSARLPPSATALPVPDTGSLLELTGTYDALGGWGRPVFGAGEFELIVNTPEDVRLLARPPWWTLRRLFVLVGGLLVGLTLAAIWISQLSRRVEERTVQLQHEIRERERAEQQRMVAEEKSRIARDLHDDLGSSLTAVGMQAGLARRTQLAAEQAAEQFDLIAEKTRGMVSALDVIVWAVDPEEDTLATTVEYMAGYVGEFLHSSGLEGRFQIPVHLPEVKLEGRTRHGLFLAVKEAVNNCVRHARATAVEFSVTANAGELTIVIADNGTGFNPETTSGGHGMGNLTKRLQSLGGACRIESGAQTGTRIIFNLPLKP